MKTNAIGHRRGRSTEPTLDHAALTALVVDAQPCTAKLGVGFIHDAAGQWRSLGAPAVGVCSSQRRAVSPHSRHVVGFCSIDDGSGCCVHDRQTNAGTLIPGGAGLLAVGAIDNSGRLIGSGTDRKPLAIILEPARWVAGWGS